MQDDSRVRAKRSLGQNFLQDENTARRIAEALRIKPEDRVMEIGPGTGAMTRWIFELGPKSFVALEKDRELAPRLKERWPDLMVVNTDALTFPWESVSPENPWKICGNLPYNVASPLMWEIFSRAGGLARAVFMVQKEVGQRLAAAPGSKQFGALSVWTQSFVRPRIEFIVPPHVFRPRPKVHSAVLSFVPVGDMYEAFDRNALSALLKVCFQARRKQLQKILRSYLGENGGEKLKALGIDPAARPETLSIVQFHCLADALKDRFLS